MATKFLYFRVGTATATEELKEVLEMMKSENTTDWIYLYRQ